MGSEASFSLLNCRTLSEKTGNSGSFPMYVVYGAGTEVGNKTGVCWGPREPPLSPLSNGHNNTWGHREGAFFNVALQFKSLFQTELSYLRISMCSVKSHFLHYALRWSHAYKDVQGGSTLSTSARWIEKRKERLILVL